MVAPFDTHGCYFVGCSGGGESVGVKSGVVISDSRLPQALCGFVAVVFRKIGSVVGEKAVKQVAVSCLYVKFSPSPGSDTIYQLGIFLGMRN